MSMVPYSQIKDKLIKDLVTDLTEKEMASLVKTVQNKIDKGASALDVGLQLVNAAAQVIHYMFPDLAEADVIELAEDVSDALIDRVIEHVSGTTTTTEEKIPHDQLN